MQFDGRSRAEALQECSSAVEKLREYTTVSQDDALQAANQSPADASAPATQVGQFCSLVYKKWEHNINMCSNQSPLIVFMKNKQCDL